MDATPIGLGSGIGAGKTPVPASSITRKADAVHPPAGPPAEDIVELSSEGKAASNADVESRLGIAPMREIDAELSEIVAEIKAGAYLTPKRIEGTVVRLFETIG